MKLKEYLDKSGVKQNFLASKAGISPVSLNAYALGKKTPNIETAWKIQKATNGEVTFNDWLEEASINTDTDIQKENSHDRKKRISKH